MSNRQSTESKDCPARQIAIPTVCYLCDGGELVLRFPARGSSGSERTFYGCTSFGHGRHEPIWACRRCGLLFQWPMPDAETLFHAYQDVEDPVYVRERHNRYLTFGRVVSELGPARGRRLLDVGAYCGYFVDVARAVGFHAEGIELSAWAVAQADTLGVTVHPETLTDRASSGDRYDVLTLWDVVEHLRDPRAELTAALRLLRGGGRLHLSTIDAGSRTARLLGRRWPWLMDMHLYYFDRSTIAALLEQAGFRVIGVRNYTHIVSARYLLQKAGAAFGPVRPLAQVFRGVVPRRWRVPVNLGDNMHVVAERLA